MSAERVISITTEDGQSLAVSQQRHPSRSYGMSFHTCFDEPVAKIAREATTAGALKVFLILPRHLSYTTYRRLDQRKLGAEIGLDDSTVSRSLKQLHQLGAVERRGAGPSIEWKLSPDYGWRGDVDSYHAERRQRGSKAPGAKPAASALKVAEGIFQVTDATPAKAQEQTRKPKINQTALRLLVPLKSLRDKPGA